MRMRRCIVVVRAKQGDRVTRVSRQLDAYAVPWSEPPPASSAPGCTLGEELAGVLAMRLVRFARVRPIQVAPPLPGRDRGEVDLSMRPEVQRPAQLHRRHTRLAHPCRISCMIPVASGTASVNASGQRARRSARTSRVC